MALTRAEQKVIGRHDLPFGSSVLVAAGTYFENVDFLGKAIQVRTTAGAGIPRTLFPPVLPGSRPSTLATSTGVIRAAQGSNGAAAAAGSASATEAIVSENRCTLFGIMR